jgi:hypothetical protein
MDVSGTLEKTSTFSDAVERRSIQEIGTTSMFVIPYSAILRENIGYFRYVKR